MRQFQRVQKDYHAAFDKKRNPILRKESMMENINPFNNELTELESRHTQEKIEKLERENKILKENNEILRLRYNNLLKMYLKLKRTKEGR